MAETNAATIDRFESSLHIGLGDAIQRLVRVEMMYSRGLTPGRELLDEAAQIVEAMNARFTLDLGLDCDTPEVPTSIEYFAHSAATSCCRIVPDAPKEKKVRSKSR